MTPDDFKRSISRALKEQRERQGLSLDGAARLTGVSKAMLGQIERRESVPTIAVLWKIASGLRVSFSAFFASAVTGAAARAGTGAPRPLPGDPSDEAAFADDPHMKVRVVFPFDPATRMEFFEVALSGSHEQLSSPHQPGVVEHVVVLSGRLAVLFDGQWHEAEPGRALRFPADQPHGYRAVTPEATFQNVICYT
ncbi:transcriptional regulator, XRE family [Desulfovibrio sp. X2]|uniref:helix-turn-helix domain-containing protein n=1 Tax=Desulfovibrio sp. X2 TaxID=941449 RepID=UPI000358C891|nr:XRE family transcriptional regulator [Desulfovibrio sp. X2]EPR44487.1 transcriptional regulator, XRE family [Desulfovibrio sp. X2]